MQLAAHNRGISGSASAHAANTARISALSQSGPANRTDFAGSGKRSGGANRTGHENQRISWSTAGLGTLQATIPSGASVTWCSRGYASWRDKKRAKKGHPTHFAVVAAQRQETALLNTYHHPF
jgi:hypothetical protein